jgi:hypothetical protein
MLRKFVVIVTWVVMLVGLHIGGWTGAFITAIGSFFSLRLGFCASNAWSAISMLFGTVVMFLNLILQGPHDHPWLALISSMLIWAAFMVGLLRNPAFAEYLAQEAEKAARR